MKLADLRKLAVKRQYRIRFTLPNGMDCVVDERGIARVPALRQAPDFSLEEQLKSVSGFVLDPAVPNSGRKAPASRAVTSNELAEMLISGTSEASRHDDHDE